MLIITCIKVFLARIVDVSLGVLRTMELVKRNISKAVIIAFFEVFLWLLIAREAITDNNIFIIIFYSLGYAIGTLVGAKLSDKFSHGTSRVDIISNHFTKYSVNKIKRLGYGITTMDMDDNKKYVMIETNNNSLDKLINIINKIDNKAFIRIYDTKLVINGFIK